MVPMDSTFSSAPSEHESQESAKKRLLNLILEWGHHRAVAGTGDGVRAAWVDINDELENNWRLK